MIMSLSLPKNVLINHLNELGCYENSHYKFIGRGNDIDMFDVPYHPELETDIMY